MLQKIFLFILLLLGISLKSQTLYWIGGSGNFHDGQHWALQSNGKPSGLVPQINSHVIFDDNSATYPSIVEITQNVAVSSITSFLDSKTVELIGTSPLLQFKIKSAAELNPNINFNFEGKVFIEPTQDATFQFSHTVFKNDIIINSNHKIDLGVINSNANVFFNGSIQLINSVIKANEVNLLNANLYLEHSTVYAQSALKLGSNMVSGIPNTGNRLIVPTTGLTAQQTTSLTNSQALKYLNPMPASCTPTLVAFKNPTCKGLCNGSATISIAGCADMPVNITWLNTNTTGDMFCAMTPTASIGYNSTTYTVNTLCRCSDQYIVLVEDANGNTGSPVFVSITDPPQTILNFTSTQPTCNSLCNGQIRANVISGQPPLSITWNPPAVTHTNVLTRDTLKNACAGNYSITAINAFGCVDNFTFTLIQPNVLLANGLSSSVTCGGTCNGSATLSPTGGTSPYSYSWTSGTPGNTDISSGLCAGVVSATVTDTKSCTATYSAVILQPPATTVTVSKTNLSCSNVCNGSATVTSTGGTPPFTYTLMPGSVSTSSVITGLCVGSYSVIAADAQGCVKTVTFIITSPPTLTASPTQTNIACNSFCTGVINLNPSGGTGVYSYNWNPSLSNAPNQSSLCAGAYNYTITDVLNCTYLGTISITQPPATTLTVNHSDISCFSLCNGSATVTPSGGTPTHSYTWTPNPPSGQGTGIISNLCVGTYSAAIRDANGCLSNTQITITQPASVTPNISTVQPTCNGLCNGSINASPTGGTGAYTFTLQSSSTSNTSSPPYTNLCAGLYTLYIGNNNCVTTRTINLTQPNPLTLALNASPISCSGQCNSNISAVVGGGTPSYTVNWSTSNTGLVITNQCVGTYSAVLTDAMSCTVSAAVTVTAPTALTININPTQPLCFGNCNGIATASVTGGTPNYTYQWAPNTNTTSINSGLCAGIYSLTVRDNLLCSQTATVAIISPTQLTLSSSNGTTSCNGVCNGTVGVVASGGTPNYSYSWNTVPVQTTSITAATLCQGNYNVTVTDQNNCTASASANVAQPTVLTASVTGNQSSCNVCIGAATITANGGTPGYSYIWTNSSNAVVSNTNTANNLCVGFYTVTITDAMGCVTTRTLEIKQTVIVVVTTNGNTLQCNGGCTGIASANPTGGLPPYNYNWTPTTPTQTTSTANGLCAGVYTVLVADALGCSNTGTVVFTNPPATTVTVVKTDETCFGQCNGTASVTATGGAGSHTYQWLPGGQTTASISGLCGGIYTVNVTDGNNCIQSHTVQINSATSITAVITPTNPTTCTSNDGALLATVSGGTGPYTFTWSPGNSTTNPYTNLGAGAYTLNVRDALGCTQTIGASLSNPSGPTLTVVSSSISCFGQCNGSATVTAVGVSSFTYNWSSGSTPTSSTTAGLCAGNVALTVTDGNNCITSTILNIAQPTQLTNVGVATNVTCNGLCSGSINITPSGGITPYTYTWSPIGVNVQDPTNLCVGNYSVLVSDANGCVVTNTYAISQPSLLTLSFNKRDVLCNGGCTGSVTVNATGGTGALTYSWSPVGGFAGSSLNNIINLCSGIYSVTVTDALGCSITGTIDIGEPAVLTTSVVSANATCNLLCNGASTLSAFGGTAPYNYNWNTTPVATTSIVTTLCAGNYLGTVTDANGCVSSKSITISEPSPITTTITPTNPKCNTSCDGAFISNSNGGTGAYTYSWIPVSSPTNTLQNPTGLCAGSYTLIVTDANNCKHQITSNLTAPTPLFANATFTNPLCSGVCDGVATANAVGGTSPYNYTWDSPTVVAQTVSNLCAGVYTITVSDANLCVATQVVTLINPTVIGLNPAVTPATCGSNNGSIDASAISGSGPFTYNWAPIVSTQSVVTGLAAGVYTVVITNTNSCSNTFVIPLGNSNGPTDVTITSTNVSCNGQCSGAAVISNPVGGTPSYTLSWVIPSNPTATLTGLCVGGYSAQVIDANGCLYFEGVAIAEPQTIVDNPIVNSATCFGNCNGSVALTPTGGNGGYTYNWSPSANTGTVTNLCPGVVTATITDVLGCTLISTYTVGSLTTITSNTFATNNICFGDCNGSLGVTNVLGGSLPYNYLWTDGLGQTTAVASNLCNGSYSVTITDAVGCIGYNAGTISSPVPITATAITTDPSCGMCNGSATLTPSGGNGNYTEVWTNSQTGTVVTNLCAGLYGVQITDALGCVSNTNIVVNNSSGITGETISKQDEACAGTCNGTATITAVGGTSPITYNWVHNNSSSQIQTGLCAGTYFCNMTDANGCTRTASVVINSAASLTITSQVFQSACGASTGSIIATASGGAGTYTYSWIPSSLGTSTLVTGLGAGIYTLNVIDANGCSKQEVYVLNTINAPVITSTVVNTKCVSPCTGSIDINISGGVPSYTINWFDNSSGLNVSNLCTGTYSVRVTDNAGCVAVQNYTLSGANSITFNTAITNNPLCFNACNGDVTTLPTGGLLPYTFSWSPSNSTSSTAGNLCAGSQTVFVTDNNGCTVTQTYSLTNPASYSVTLAVINPTCNTLPDGSVDLTVLGGTPTYSYSWVGATTTSTNEDLTNVLMGTYSVTITDVNGCQKDTSVTLISNLIVIAIAGDDTTFCENGTLLLDGSNSLGGINYNWFIIPTNSLVASSQTTIISPSTGTSTYVLIASNGNCINSDTVLVTAHLLPVVDAGPSSIIPINTSTLIGGSPTGPTGSTFVWTPNIGTLDNATISNPTASNTVTTQYTVTVTDSNSCMNSDTVTVFIYPQINPPSGFSPNADGKNDVWQLDNIQLFPDNVVEVYNRWGEQLFISYGYNTPFDGKYKGKDLPVGTYYYIINLNHPSFPEAFTGPLTIFR